MVNRTGAIVEVLLTKISAEQDVENAIELDSDDGMPDPAPPPPRTSPVPPTFRAPAPKFPPINGTPLEIDRMAEFADRTRLMADTTRHVHRQFRRSLETLASVDGALREVMDLLRAVVEEGGQEFAALENEAQLRSTLTREICAKYNGLQASLTELCAREQRLVEGYTAVMNATGISMSLETVQPPPSQEAFPEIDTPPAPSVSRGLVERWRKTLDKAEAIAAGTEFDWTVLTGVETDVGRIVAGAKRKAGEADLGGGGRSSAVVGGGMHKGAEETTRGGRDKRAKPVAEVKGKIPVRTADAGAQVDMRTDEGYINDVKNKAYAWGRSAGYKEGQYAWFDGYSLGYNHGWHRAPYNHEGPSIGNSTPVVFGNAGNTHGYGGYSGQLRDPRGKHGTGADRAVRQGGSGGNMSARLGPVPQKDGEERNVWQKSYHPRGHWSKT